MGLSNLWLPTLRGVIERNISAVAAGRRSKGGRAAGGGASIQADFEAAQAQVGGGATALVCGTMGGWVGGVCWGGVGGGGWVGGWWWWCGGGGDLLGLLSLRRACE